MLLAIGTAHRACSLALIDNARVVRTLHEDIGRGHAEQLVPMLRKLCSGERPDEIAVEIGPGSFTGIRVGIAAARALALAWRIPIGGMTSTALLAVEAFAEEPELDRITVLLDGGRGEVFAQTIGWNGEALDDVRAIPAAEARPVGAVIGTGINMVDPGKNAQSLGPRSPKAEMAVFLTAEQRALPPSPLYIRAPDAKRPRR